MKKGQKLSKDIAYTLASFGLLAISGIVINIGITVFRDATALGVFNLSYAVYLIAAQIAAFGINYSVLRFSAFYKEDACERGRLLLSAMLLSLVFGLCMATLTYQFSTSLGSLFKSVTIGHAIANCAYGLALFPLNKVLQAYLNGLRHMKAFSLFQGLRYLSVMITTLMFTYSSLSIEYALFGFAIAEGLSLGVSLCYILLNTQTGPLQWDMYWAKKHLAFGGKGLLSGLFADVNSKLDVLLIGFFLTDRAVGVYSFAAMIIDGLYHLLAMIRINFNPVLVNVLRDDLWDEGKKLLSMSKRYVLPTMLFLALLVCVSFWVMTSWLVPEKGLQSGFLSLCILLAGMVTISFLVPFDNLLIIAGFPVLQTVQQVVMVGSNAALAAILLPILGIEGAAIATVVGFLSGITVLIVLSRQLIGWNLLKNTQVRFN